jgi:probable F420-dependent oxidoreductase
VDFGVSLTFLSPRLWGDVAEAADDLGFESLWIAEHLVVPVASTGSPHAGADHPPIPSDLPIYDALAYLAYLAARTTRIKLGTHVYNVGLRHPFVTARAATTVDVVSNGRLAFGIGASWLREEWEATGLDFDRRGARVDETIDVLQRLWSEDVVEHHGEFFDFGPTAFEPKPVQRPGPALHIGGDGPAALRRAATVGTGWIPMNHALDDLGPSLERLGRIAQRHGRTTPIEVTISGDVTSPADVERYEKAGVTRLIVRPWSRSSEALDGVRRFADEVLRPIEEQV